MKILMIAPIPMLVDRGGSIRVYEELRALKEKGISVRCLTYHLGRDIEEIKLDRIPSVPFYRQENPGGSYLRLFVDFLLFIKAFSIAREFKPDLIHAHLHDGGLCGIGLRKLLGIPVLLDAQGSLTQEMIAKNFIPPASRRFRFFLRIESYICREVDRIITSSHFLKSKIKDEFKVRKIEYFGDGVNLSLFTKEPDAAAVKKKYGLDGKTVVIYTGILTPFQGLDLLFETAALASREKNDLRFLIVGFPDVDLYKKKVISLGLEEKVIFTGKKSYFDMPKFLSAADIAVSPKVPGPGEGNLKLFTYMASGLPAIVLDTADNREILGEGGLYCQPHPDSLAEGIIQLARDKALREEMGKKARERAQARYSWADKAAELINIYEEVVSDKKKREKGRKIKPGFNWRIKNSYTLKKMAMGLLTNPSVVNNPLYRFFYVKRIRQQMARGVIFPPEVQIESTNACNARCSMCFRDEMDRPIGFMDFALFRKIIDECSQFKKARLCFSFCGEPLLDPRLADKISYAKGKGMEYVYFFTNMSLLDKFKGRQLMEAGLDEIKVSLDGFTTTTYQAIRRGLDFEKVKYNLREFLASRGKGHKPLVSIMITLLRENKDEIELARQEWGGLVDGLVFKSFDTFARQIPPQSEELTFNKSYSYLRRYPCHYLWNQFMVLWDGRAVLCCKDFNGRVTVGDISKETIGQVWGGEALEYIRKCHKQGAYGGLPLCKDCSYLSVWW